MTFANVVIKSYLLKRYVGDDRVFTQGPPFLDCGHKGRGSGCAFGAVENEVF
jgi:hypothetical protein